MHDYSESDTGRQIREMVHHPQHQNLRAGASDYLGSLDEVDSLGNSGHSNSPPSSVTGQLLSCYVLLLLLLLLLLNVGSRFEKEIRAWLWEF